MEERVPGRAKQRAAEIVIAQQPGHHEHACDQQRDHRRRDAVSGGGGTEKSDCRNNYASKAVARQDAQSHAHAHKRAKKQDLAVVSVGCIASEKVNARERPTQTEE